MKVYRILIDKWNFRIQIYKIKNKLKIIQINKIATIFQKYKKIKTKCGLIKTKDLVLKFFIVFLIINN